MAQNPVKYPVVPDGSLGFATSRTVYLFGNPIEWNSSRGLFEYLDGTPVLSDTLRPCVKCNELPVDGCDPCLGKLPGVESACCGHGVKKGYVIFKNGIKLKGTFKVKEEPLPLKDKWW